MPQQYTESELEAYLDEALAPDEMARVEAALRENPKLLKKLAMINGRRDAGLHSLGEIWRRHRVSCPTREQLGSYLLGVLSDEHVAYVEFHFKQIGCRFCIANLEDLGSQRSEASDDVATRRLKYFQTSAEYLGKRKKK